MQAWFSKNGSKTLIAVYATLTLLWLVLALFDASHHPERVKMELVLAASAALVLAVTVNARRRSSE